MEPVQDGVQISPEEKLRQLRWRFAAFGVLVLIVILLTVGLVLGWIAHDHVVVHIRRSSDSTAALLTPGGER